MNLAINKWQGVGVGVNEKGCTGIPYREALGGQAGKDLEIPAEKGR